MPHGSSVQVWIIDRQVDAATLERLGDGRIVADQLESGVGTLIVSNQAFDTGSLIAGGADQICLSSAHGAGQQTRVDIATQVLANHRPRLVLAPGDPAGREWASRLAKRAGWHLVSPALMVKTRENQLEVTHLNSTDKKARQLRFGSDSTVVVTMREGVADALVPDADRTGSVETIPIDASREPIRLDRAIPADPQTTDIRFVDRLVAGGRGLGSREGFESLRRFADKIDAGIAASRMAVDLGWCELERQVGQTGKTVDPEVYIACGISGASHHVDGMSAAKHIIAINTDRNAPIFKIAHLALVADLFEVLREAEKGLDE